MVRVVFLLSGVFHVAFVCAAGDATDIALAADNECTSVGAQGVCAVNALQTAARTAALPSRMLAAGEGPVSEATYKQAVALQFASPAFEKDDDGALTDAGGLKICAAWLRTIGEGVDLTAATMWEAVQLYHGRGQKVKVTASQWQDATWWLAKDQLNLVQLSKRATKGPVSEATYKQAVALQFASPAFEKDDDGALTDAGGLKICAAWLRTIGEGVDLTAATMWEAVQLYHGRGQKVKVTASQWQDATWWLAEDAMKS